MTTFSIPKPCVLTIDAARQLKKEATRRGKLSSLNHRILSALVGGFNPIYEQNLMVMWEVLNEQGAEAEDDIPFVNVEEWESQQQGAAEVAPTQPQVA